MPGRCCCCFSQFYLSAVVSVSLFVLFSLPFALRLRDSPLFFRLILRCAAAQLSTRDSVNFQSAACCRCSPIFTRISFEITSVSRVIRFVLNRLVECVIPWRSLRRSRARAFVLAQVACFGLFILFYFIVWISLIKFVGSFFGSPNIDRSLTGLAVEVASFLLHS